MCVSWSVRCCWLTWGIATHDPPNRLPWNNHCSLGVDRLGPPTSLPLVCSNLPSDGCQQSMGFIAGSRQHEAGWLTIGWAYDPVHVGDYNAWAWDTTWNHRSQKEADSRDPNERNSQADLFLFILSHTPIYGTCLIFQLLLQGLHSIQIHKHRNSKIRRGDHFSSIWGGLETRKGIVDQPFMVRPTNSAASSCALLGMG